MFDNFLAKDQQKWENHKMNKNLDVSSTIVHTTVLYIFATLEKIKGGCIKPHF